MSELHIISGVVVGAGLVCVALLFLWGMCDAAKQADEAAERMARAARWHRDHDREPRP